MTTQAIAQTALTSIETRILEFSPDVQQRIRSLAEAIFLFTGSHGNVGTMALNLATARKAVEVLP